MAAADKKDDKPASTRAQAVANFTVPVTAAWLLAVGGILTWGMAAGDLLENAGKIVAAIGGGVAFLTVILSAVQDAIPLVVKQWLLFPRRKRNKEDVNRLLTWPSHKAFSVSLMRKADLETVADFEALKDDPDAQNKRWRANYNAYRDRAGVAAFSARHIAWREMVPVMFLLSALTFVLLWTLGRPDTICLWHYLVGACLIILALSWYAGRRSSIGLVIAVLERMRDEGDKTLASPTGAGPGTG